MNDKIIIDVSLKNETVRQLDDILQFCKVKQIYSDYDLPLNHEDILKAALSFYLNHLQQLQKKKANIVTDITVLKLSKPGKLKNSIKEYITKKKMLQKELAELTSLDQGTISIILSNRSQPSLENFLRIWIALGCPPIEDLFYKEDT